MPSYILLSRLTDEGRRTLKDRPERLLEVNRELEAMGGRVRQQFALLGPHDFMTVVDAPDNATVTAIAVALGSRGTVRLETLPAFPTDVPSRGLLSFDLSRMTRFAVFTKLTAEGRLGLESDPERLTAVSAEAQRLGARITHQYRVVGEYDYVTIVEAPDNATASKIAAEVSGLGSVKLNVYPAIANDRFVELLKIRAYRTEPHRWQTQPWARAVRRVGRYALIIRHVQHFCRPLTIEGTGELRGFEGPALVIANHSSHFDTPVALTALPGPLRAKTAVAAAADRFYRTNRRTWWYSLIWNTFPIQRGGGSNAVEYPMSLLKRGWSILIYPEGGRFKPGQIQRFHHGVTLMAMAAKVPVLPIYMEGLGDVMPKGVRNPRPAPVRVRLGQPVSLDGIQSVPDGTALLEDAMRELASTASTR